MLAPGDTLRCLRKGSDTASLRDGFDSTRWTIRDLPRGSQQPAFRFRLVSTVFRMILLSCGAIAQPGERLHGMQEVRGSIPLGSTNRSVYWSMDSVHSPCPGSHLNQGQHTHQSSMLLMDWARFRTEKPVLTRSVSDPGATDGGHVSRTSPPSPMTAGLYLTLPPPQTLVQFPVCDESRIASTRHWIRYPCRNPKGSTPAATIAAANRPISIAFNSLKPIWCPGAVQNRP